MHGSPWAPQHPAASSTRIIRQPPSVLSVHAVRRFVRAGCCVLAACDLPRAASCRRSTSILRSFEFESSRAKQCLKHFALNPNLPDPPVGHANLHIPTCGMCRLSRPCPAWIPDQNWCICHVMVVQIGSKWAEKPYHSASGEEYIYN